MNRRLTSIGLGIVMASTAPGTADDLLLAIIEFDGLPTGVQSLNLTTGEVLGAFVVPDYFANGMLDSVEAISAGPGRTLLFGQPGGEGKISQYDELGAFMRVYLGAMPDPNPVDNIRSMATSPDGLYLYTSDWDHDDVHRFNLIDGSPAGLDAFGVFISGMQVPPGLDLPQAIEYRSNGMLLVSDLVAHTIREYDAVTGIPSAAPFTATELGGSITDIDELDNGDIVVSEDGSADRVRRFGSDGTLLNEFAFNGPDGVHVLPDGNYLVTSHATSGQGSGLFRVAPDGQVLEVIDVTRGYGAIERVTLIDGCIADFDANGLVNTADFLAYLNAFTADDDRADLAPPFGVLNTADFLEFLNLFVIGC